MTAERIPATTKHPPYEGEVDDLSIIYPSTDGEPMAEDDAQLTAMLDTIPTLREWFDNREDVYAGGDMLMYYRMNDNQTRVAPDVFVVFGVGKHSRRSWIVWREGKAPDLVMEMASGSTWRRDMREKRDIYASMGVTEYWRFDPTGNYFTPPLIGERLEGAEYQPMPLATDGEGVLWGRSAVLRLDICARPGPEGNLLRLYDPDSGQWLRTHHEEAAARQATEAALRDEAAARQATETALRDEAAARRSAEDELRLLRERLRELQSE